MNATSFTENILNKCLRTVHINRFYILIEITKTLNKTPLGLVQVIIAGNTNPPITFKVVVVV